MRSAPALFLFALSTSITLVQATPPAAPHPGLWERYKIHPGLSDFSGPGTSLVYEPIANTIYGQFGNTVWGGAPFDADTQVALSEEDLALVFSPFSTFSIGDFTRLFYLNDTLIITGDVMSWLGFEPSLNASGWFARNASNPWPSGYVFTGLAFGNVVGNITIPAENGTSSNGTWVCLRKAVNATVDMYSNESYYETVLTSGSLKQICVDSNVTIVGIEDGMRQPLINDVLFAEGVFVAVGQNPVNKQASVLSSTDGIVWTPANITGVNTQSAGSSQTLTRVRYGGGQFVAVGYQSCCIVGVNNTALPPPLIVSSPDGVTWSRYQFPEPFLYAALTDVVYNGQAWVAVGDGTYVGVGDQWQPVYWHLNMSGAPSLPPVPPLDNLLYLPSVNLYYATAQAAIYVAKSLLAGQECNVTDDCSGRVLLPPYEDVKVCSPVLHTCVECAVDSDCPGTLSFCNVTGGNYCSKRIASSALASVPFMLILFALLLLVY